MRKYLYMVLTLALIVGTWAVVSAQTGITTFQVSQAFVNSVNTAISKINAFPFSANVMTNNISMNGYALQGSGSFNGVGTNGGTLTTGVIVNGRIPPETFVGNDLCAKIQAAETYCATTKTLNTCNIDASSAYLAKTSACTNRIVLTVPTKLTFAGNIDYTGAGNTAGVIEFAAGSDGSELTCEPSGLDQNDPSYNFGEGGSSNFTKQVGCSLTAEFSSATAKPIVVIDSGVSRIRIHDMNIMGDSSVTDGIDDFGRDGVNVQRVSITHERPSGTPSNPTGWAFNATAALPQNVTVFKDNVVVGWTQGAKFNETGGGSDIGDNITGNTFVIMGGQELFVSSLTTSVIQGNQFLSMFPAAGSINKIEFAGTNQNLLFQANHSECDNQTAQSNIIELAVDSGATMRSDSFINNSFHGNTGCIASSTDDPDHLIDWAATAGWNNVISGNDFAGALNGQIKLASNSVVFGIQQNNVKAPINGETACTAEPGPAAGCLLMSGSALPKSGQESEPLTFSGLLGGLTSTAGATLYQACTTMSNSGVLNLLTLTNDLNGATCTTAPTYNIVDVTQTTAGTAKAASTAAGAVTQAETLTYSAGDQVCLVRTINGGTCSTPLFNVTAHGYRID